MPATITTASLPPPRAPASSGAALALHGALACAVLLGCLALPRPGAAVLLLPLDRQPATARIGWLARAGMTPSGLGPVPGSLIVHSSSGVPIAALLRHALLPLAVPARLCTTPALASPVSSPTGAGPHLAIREPLNG